MKWKNVWGSALSLISLLLIIPSIISGCAGGGTETSNPSMDSGDVYVSLTDAEGDFISYQVDVTSITLEKLNGAVVEALPLSTTVDFAALTELTELVTAATIPSGVYVKAVMSLDYSNCQILAEGANGDPVQLTPKDADGNPISQLDVSVSLSNRKFLTIAPGVPASLTLDFDLLATNEVDLVNEAVTVQPMLSAEVNVQASKPHRIRGPLVSVDETEMSFVLKLWPTTPTTVKIGKVTVFATENTVFEVDGEEAAGSEGVALLAAKDPTTAVLAIVRFNPQTFKLEAEQVYAGSSVAGGELDGLTGTIIKREGDVLTVRGASLERASGTIFINSDVEVLLGEATTVTRQQSDGVSIDALSVGQKIVALGQYQENGQVGAVTPGTFDATQGVVRMLLTAAAGQVVASDGELVLTLQRLDGRRTDASTLFDFSGTGATAESDADPDNYQIDVGTLSLDSVKAGDSVRVFGFVTPFGSAAPPDEYDFEAVSIVNATEAKANIAVNWKFFADSTLSIDNDSLVLDLTKAGIFHHVLRLWISLELDIEQTPTVVCDDAAGNGVFTISQGGAAAVYTKYSEFIAALSSELDAGTQALVLTGAGYFDDGALTFRAKKINIILKQNFAKRATAK